MSSGSQTVAVSDFIYRPFNRSIMSGTSRTYLQYSCTGVGSGQTPMAGKPPADLSGNASQSCITSSGNRWSTDSWLSCCTGWTWKKYCYWKKTFLVITLSPKKIFAQNPSAIYPTAKKLHFREHIFYTFTLTFQKRDPAYPFTLKDWTQCINLLYDNMNISNCS